MSERMFPIQTQRGYPRAFPLLIPWSVAMKAYGKYASEYGTRQSLERLAERGGFGPGEMDEFYPGWLEEVSEITALKGRQDRLVAMLKRCEWYPSDLWSVCPICDQDQDTGSHKDGCELAALLSEFTTLPEKTVRPKPTPPKAMLFTKEGGIIK